MEFLHLVMNVIALVILVVYIHSWQCQHQINLHYAMCMIYSHTRKKVDWKVVQSKEEHDDYLKLFCGKNLIWQDILINNIEIKSIVNNQSTYPTNLKISLSQGREYTNNYENALESALPLLVATAGCNVVTATAGSNSVTHW